MKQQWDATAIHLSAAATGGDSLTVQKLNQLLSIIRLSLHRILILFFERPDDDDDDDQDHINVHLFERRVHLSQVLLLCAETFISFHHLLEVQSVVGNST